MRTKVQLSVGQIVLSLMNLPRYRSQTLGDLAHLVLDPLTRDRVAMAYQRRKDEPEEAEGEAVGIALWASVSAEVDAKITEQVKAGVFPVRLSNADWTSGDQVWLLDVVAADRKHATSVLANFRQVSGEHAVKIHPMAARLVEPGILEKMQAKPVEAGMQNGGGGKGLTPPKFDVSA